MTTSYLRPSPAEPRFAPGDRVRALKPPPARAHARAALRPRSRRDSARAVRLAGVPGPERGRRGRGTSSLQRALRRRASCGASLPTPTASCTSTCGRTTWSPRHDGRAVARRHEQAGRHPTGRRRQAGVRRALGRRPRSRSRCGSPARATSRGTSGAATLSEEIRAAQQEGDPDLGDTYYRHWLRALERLCRERGLVSEPEASNRQEAWRRAYLNTPHGKPVNLAAGG